ncbi:MAG: thioredoxin domain-containing protein [Candidatus Paceibacterota bacterium]
MKKIIYIIIALLFIGGVVFVIVSPAKGGEYDTFTQCLKDSGAKFYGTFWCPHCKNQKAMFGKSVKLLPYIECSTPDGQGQLQVCKDAQITGYPTWEFANGERLTGEVALEDLAAKTSCPLVNVK